MSHEPVIKPLISENLLLEVIRARMNNACPYYGVFYLSEPFKNK